MAATGDDKFTLREIISGLMTSTRQNATALTNDSVSGGGSTTRPPSQWCNFAYVMGDEASIPKKFDDTSIQDFFSRREATQKYQEAYGLDNLEQISQLSDDELLSRGNNVVQYQTVIDLKAEMERTWWLQHKSRVRLFTQHAGIKASSGYNADGKSASVQGTLAVALRDLGEAPDVS